MTQRKKDSVILGLALFAMFFGAGNLIFPTSVGLTAGSNWLASLSGFSITGIILPLLGVMAVMMSGGTMSSFASKAGKGFGLVYGTAVISALGLVAVSRTAATTYEMGVSPMLPWVSPVVSSVLFFAITWLLAINPSGIIDRIGKILTPVLLAMLAVIIVKGVFFPMGQPGVTGLVQPFQFGFFGGYQTMDAMGSSILGGIVIASLLEKGYKEKRDQLFMTARSVIIAGLGLAIVYGGLLYLGATGTSIFATSLPKTTLTVSIVQQLLGETGKLILGLCVSFACLTTSVGLTATVGEYFSSLTKDKVPYKVVVTITVVLCAFIANFGVDMIVALASPILVTMYPMSIVLILMNLADRFIPDQAMYTGAVFGALSVSLFDGLQAAGIEIAAVQNLIAQLPFAESGFGWVVPTLIGLAVGPLVSKLLGSSKSNRRTPRGKGGPKKPAYSRS